MIMECRGSRRITGMGMGYEEKHVNNITRCSPSAVMG